jgi:hypothetical protein
MLGLSCRMDANSFTVPSRLSDAFKETAIPNSDRKVFGCFRIISIGSFRQTSVSDKRS